MFAELTLAQIVFISFFIVLTIGLLLLIRAIRQFGLEEERRQRNQRRPNRPPAA